MLIYSNKTKNTTKSNVKILVIIGLLCSIGIIIPMFSPLKIILEPASFTLGSHIAIFIAMFLSLKISLCVSIITSLGFLFGGFPIVVVLRALSHIVFAFLGSLYLKKYPINTFSKPKLIIFCTLISIIHGICEILIVLPFYSSSDFLVGVFLIIGIGTVIHSIIDFVLAINIFKAIPKKLK